MFNMVFKGMVPDLKLSQSNVNARELLRTVHITSDTNLQLMTKEKRPSEFPPNC
jgi:hypothetical protein